MKLKKSINRELFNYSTLMYDFVHFLSSELVPTMIIGLSRVLAVNVCNQYIILIKKYSPQ